MNLTAKLLPPAWLWAGFLFYLPIAGWALWRADWARMRSNTRLWNAFLGAVVVALLMWISKAGVNPGMEYHAIGATLLTLMFGWPFAILGLSAVLCGTAFNHMADWSAIPLNGLLMVVLPVAVSHGLYRAASRWLPRQFFVYVLFNGFFAAGLSFVLSVFASTAVMLLAGAYTFEHIDNFYLVFVPMMAFSEAFLTGMLIAALVLNKPEWVLTFDDYHYLAGK